MYTSHDKVIQVIDYPLYNTISRYAVERKAFGKSIGDFGQIQKAIAESYAEYMAGKTYVYDVARRLDLSSFGNGLDADSVKLFAAPIAKRVADRAIQIMGGNGYTAEYQVGRGVRDDILQFYSFISSYYSSLIRLKNIGGILNSVKLVVGHLKHIKRIFIVI